MHRGDVSRVDLLEASMRSRTCLVLKPQAPKIRTLADSSCNTTLIPNRNRILYLSAFIPSIPRRLRRTPRTINRKSFVMSLKGKNIVITGASRGIGRGLAIACGELGANVFITGRKAGSGPTSLTGVAEKIRELGGNCEYFTVDHSDDEQVTKFFKDLQAKLSSDNSSLDVLVNNAYAAVNFISASENVPFYQKNVDTPDTPDPEGDPGKVWDIINNVGLRNNYVCGVRAFQMMEKQRSGIVINITSWAGIVSLFDPAYSIGKEAIDRMSAEMALGAPEGVKCFAFCPGYVSTEELLEIGRMDEERAKAEGKGNEGRMPMWNAESPLFVGRVLAALVSEKGARIMQRVHGKVVITAEVAEILKVNDENDFRPVSFRSVRFTLLESLPFLRNSALRHLIPRTLYAPWWLVRTFIGTTRYW